MLRTANRKAWHWLSCLTLVCILLFCAKFNVKAAENSDVAVIGTTVKDGKVYTTLYCADEDKPAMIDTVCYYVDGKPRESEAALAVTWVGDKAQLVSNCTVTDRSGHLSVIISVSGDSNCSNDNRTVVLRAAMPAPPSLEEEDSGTGSGSGTILPETVDPVTDVRAEADSAGQVTVTWTSPASGLSPNNYLISRTGGAETKTFHASGTPFLDTSVSPGTTYTYTVTAQRGTLSAEPVSSNRVTTPASEAVTVNPVENLTVRSSTASFVTLAWSAPTSGTRPTGYVIYRNGTRIGETADLTYTDHTVSATTSYTYTIVAVVGTTASEGVQIRTTTAAADVSGGLADLVVTDIYVSPANPRVGDEIVITAVVKNQGTKATPNGTITGVRFGINGINGSPLTWCDNYTNSIAPGESVELTANGGNGSGNGNVWEPASAGTYTIYAWVDDQNRIPESDTNNNDDYTKTITVSEQGAITGPQGTTGNATVYVASSVGNGLTQASGIVVTVNNLNSPVFNANVNNSRYWDTLTIETTPVTIFELSREDTSAVVRVALSKSMDSVIVRPLSDGIKPVIREENDQRYAEFTITRWGSYTVEFNGSTSKALHLFVNPPYTEYSRNPSAYGYSGYQYVGLGSVSGQNYFDGGNRVYGSGVILVNGGQPSTTVNGGARLVGVTFLNPSTGPSWNMQIYGSQSDIEFNYFHMITCGRNSDGITIQSSNHVRILNSYLRAWDDCVVLKIYTPDDTHDITVDNCVFWSDLAQAMEIGAETNKGSGGYNSDPEIYNVVFSNNDVIHSFHKPALSIHNMDNARVHNVTYENITIEDASMGNNTRVNEDGWPILIDLTNTRGGELDGTADSWTSQWNAYGSIYDITYRNIQVLSWANQNTVLNQPANVLPGIRAVNSARVSGGGGAIYNINIQGLHYLQSDGTVLSINSVADLKNNTFSPNDVKGINTFDPNGNFHFTTVTNPDMKNPSDYTATYTN